MIELFILGQLWGIRQETRAAVGRDEADIEGGLLTFGFLLSILLWPILLAWPLLKIGTPRWLAFVISVLFGVVAFLVLSLIYFVVGLCTAVIGTAILIFKYA